MLIGIDANEANLTTKRVGVNQYALDLLHTFARSNTQHKFVIYLKNPPLPDLPPVSANLTYRVIPFPKLWTQTRLPWDLYTHFPRPDIFLSLTHYSPRWSPVPTVVSIMDLGFLKTPDQFTAKDLAQLKNWTAYSVKKSRHIIAISEFTKKDIQNAYHLPPEKITVIYPSYDEALFKPTPNPQILSKYNISEPYILFLSSLKPSKNVPGLVKAFSQIAADSSRLQLVIAGKKAWLYEDIFKLVKELNLEQRVIFTDYIPEEHTPVLMSHAKAYVLPSFYEGFGIPVLEAMACGVPVVVSRVASLPEVAGPAGIYVDPQSTESIVSGIKQALGSKRSEFVKLGFKQVKLFSWAKSAQSTIKLLEKLTHTYV